MNKGSAFHEGVAQAFADGVVNVPYSLLRHYGKLGLSETEMLLLVHLLAYKEKENNPFPTPDELQERMGQPLDVITRVLGHLVKQEWIFIEEKIDPGSGIQYECYSLAPLYVRLAEVMQAEQHVQSSQQPPVPFFEFSRDFRGTDEGEPEISGPSASSEQDVYAVFEKEFARPLTPMEGETITAWLEADEYPQQLVLLALKEAVFAGKLNFRYIDRILLEWHRNRIRTVEQAKEFTKQFRAGR